MSIAALCAVLSAILGTPLGIALARHRFRGKSSTDLLLFANVAAPEVVLGSALLSILLTLELPRRLSDDPARARDVQPRLRRGHRPRAHGRADPSLEEAARDLGAGAWHDFRLVTRAVAHARVVAGSLLAFALSIDDYIITCSSTARRPRSRCGSTSQTKVGVPPQVNAIGTMIFVFGVLAALANGLLLQRRGTRA